MIDIIRADWPAPVQVQALTTTRQGGVSEGPCHSLNLATHVDDIPAHVAENRRRLRQQLQLPGEPVWLEQTHSTRVVCAHEPVSIQGDASFSFQEGVVCSVLTADCLPVLICNRQGNRVAAAHAGWRGLLAGVVENTLDALGQAPEDLLVWLGPAISQPRFEVGHEVRQAFMDRVPAAAQAFEQVDESHWLADIYQLARLKLQHKGIEAVYGGDHCSYNEESRFYSYRRDGRTGRMASLIWFEK